MRLDGHRVALRDWERGDESRLAELVVPERPWHETNGPYFGRPTAQDLAGVRRDLLEMAGSETLPEPRTSLAVIRRADDLLVGTVTWYWESELTDWRRLGIVLWDESVWGQGLGGEALTLWTDYLFATTDALRLDLATFSGNPGMIALAKRIGFVEEARMRKARRWAGGVHDAVVLGVLREEWHPDFNADPAPADFTLIRHQSAFDARRISVEIPPCRISVEIGGYQSWTVPSARRLNGR